MLHCFLITFIYLPPTFLSLMLIGRTKREWGAGMVEEELDRDTIVDQVWWMRAKAALLEGLPLLLLYSLSENEMVTYCYAKPPH